MRFLCFHITRLSPSFLFFSPYFSGWACREDEAGALGPTSRRAAAWISFCVATLMSLMRVRSVSGFLTNSFLSNLLLYTTPFSILPFYTSLLFQTPSFTLFLCLHPERFKASLITFI
jgi:hypothetical protein